MPRWGLVPMIVALMGSTALGAGPPAAPEAVGMAARFQGLLGIAAILLYALRERTTGEPPAAARLDLGLQAWSGGGLFSLRGPL